MASEWYLRGDGKEFQWSELIRPGDTWIRFERTSSGTSIFNAMYRHTTSVSEWSGARMGWTGFDWVVRRSDGAVARFRPCGPNAGDICSIVRFRDADGHVTEYRRDRSGRLLRIEGGDGRWIALEYDTEGRVERAHDSTSQEVRYRYDQRGRLAEVLSSGKVTHKYTYTDGDEMATIIEPGTEIENAYENGLCVRQVNRFADGSDPFVFEYKYRLNGTEIAQVDARRSDGTRTTYTFDAFNRTTSEVWESDGTEPATFTYERDPHTHAVVSLSLTCPDRTGRPLRHSSLVRPGEEDWIKWDLARTHCSWRNRQLRTTE
jgi:YD repeat-containing protein